MASLQSIDELLESAVLALYRQWSHLPRRTTMPALDTLRHTLAAEVAALPSPPDPAPLRRAAAAFAVAALRLPLVQRAAGADLEKLAALSEDPTRPGGLRGAPLLKTTPLTPERAQVLVALLRAEDPPAYAVQRWFYVVNETPEAWRTLRAAVDPLLDHLPTAREQVQALDTLLTTAPAASPFTVPAIYEDALKQLETIPGVVAALTDQFLNWKEVQRLIRRSAAGFSVAGADAVPKGALTMDDIMPAAAISPGALPPPPRGAGNLAWPSAPCSVRSG